MGGRYCKQEKEEKVPSPTRKISTGLKVNKPSPTMLTQKEKELLQTSWKLIKDDIADVGVFTFIALFENHPDIKHAFVSFRGLQPSELNNSSVLRAHALRLMMTVDKCLYRFGNVEKVEELMKSLGNRHKDNYQVSPEHLDLMAPHFNYAIKHNLKSEWTPELEAAWKKLFELMIYFMKDGMS